MTADGREVRADETQNQELLWASKGGGGNFGVVTALEFRLHPVGPMILGGLLAWPADAATGGRTGLPRLGRRRPRTSSGPGSSSSPARPRSSSRRTCRASRSSRSRSCGTATRQTGADLVQVMRDLGPEVDLVGPMPYVELQSMIDDPPGFRQYWSADYHDTFPDEALDVFLDAGARRASPLTQHLLLPWGGALARIADDATPLTQRRRGG